MKSKEYLFLMQKILQHVDEGIHVLDKKGNTIIYNESMSNLEKMDSSDVIKKPLTEVFKGLNSQNSTLLKALKLKVETKNLKQTYLNKDGKEITTINTTLPVVIDDEVVAVVKSNNVLLSTQTNLKLSAKNSLNGNIEEIIIGSVNAEVVVNIGNEDKIVAIVTINSIENMGLKVGASVDVIIKASDIMIGK